MKELIASRTLEIVAEAKVNTQSTGRS